MPLEKCEPNKHPFMPRLPMAEGICPECGEGELSFGEGDTTEDGEWIKVTCSNIKCGWTGEIYYRITRTWGGYWDRRTGFSVDENGNQM